MVTSPDTMVKGAGWKPHIFGTEKNGCVMLEILKWGDGIIRLFFPGKSKQSKTNNEHEQHISTYIYIYIHMSNSLPMFFSNHLSIYLTYKWFTKLKVGPFVMCPFSDHHVQWCHTEVVTICYHMLQVIPLPLSPSRHRRPFAQIYLPLSLPLSICPDLSTYLPTYLSKIICT